MELVNVTAQAYLSATIVCFLLATIYSCHWFTSGLSIFTPIAAWVSFSWLVLMTYWVGSSTPNQSHFSMEILQGFYYFCWITAIERLTQQQARSPIATKVLWISALAALITYQLFVIMQLTLYSHWLILILTIMAIVTVEQLYRATIYNRYVKLIGISLGIIFVFDGYLYTYQLFAELDKDLLQARAALMIIVLALMCIGALAIPFKSQQLATIDLSRPVVFYTTSMAIIGIIGSLLIIGGYYLRLYSGEWGNLIYSGGLFLAIVAIAIVYTSGAIRDQVSVLINKHLFLHKYDYRIEWLKLIDRLSGTSREKKRAYRQALNAINSLFKSGGGLLWLKQTNQFELAHTEGLTSLQLSSCEPSNSAFCQRLLNEEWVYIPGSDPRTAPSNSDDLLPEWIEDIPDVWFVMPLISESQLIGFIVLTKPLLNNHLTWEDLDLIKSAGRQVADFLYRHQQTEELTEAQQFETFSRLTAFIMHDLKNLIAQQALVVDNAAKHKNNPAFIEDAIHTIDNSVKRMNTLLRKLQRDLPEEITNFSLSTLLLEATKSCEHRRPAPTLQLPDNDMFISADFDRLSMAISHLIQNAQEAITSKPTGYVNVQLYREQDTAIITIEDNGMGMSKEFIRDKLFKPFETTKSGKGMGIGVYQARSIVKLHNGEIVVDSTPNTGTKFTLKFHSIT